MKRTEADFKKNPAIIMLYGIRTHVIRREERQKEIWD
jgi:hypothetical protein